MQLTKFTDYSLRILIYLGCNHDRPATASEISEVYGISREHLRKIVHHLGKLGYIETKRGKSGGIRLIREPKDISVGQVVLDTEDELGPAECHREGTPPCAIDGACELKGALMIAVEAYIEVLNRYTLADVLDNKADLRQCLSIPAPPG